MSALETITYSVGVKTPAGWRAVTATATAQRISPKRVRVVAVTALGGEQVMRNMSRTGSQRQAYSGEFVARLESGKVKNVAVQS